MPSDMSLKIGEFSISIVAVFDNADYVRSLQDDQFLKGELLMNE